MTDHINLRDHLMAPHGDDANVQPLPLEERFDVTPDFRKVAASMGLAFVLVVALIALSEVPSYGATNPDVTERVGLMLAWRNESISPCASMYDYACRSYNFQTTAGDTPSGETARMTLNELDATPLPPIGDDGLFHDCVTVWEFNGSVYVGPVGNTITEAVTVSSVPWVAASPIKWIGGVTVDEWVDMCNLTTMSAKAQWDSLQETDPSAILSAFYNVPWLYPTGKHYCLAGCCVHGHGV